MRCGCSSPSSCRTSSACRRWPSGAGVSAAWRPTTPRRTRAAPTPCTRWGKRDDRPAGHRHQAVQAARRVQLHQDLPADRRRAANGRCRSRRWSSWPRSSRTAGSIPRRPTIGGGCSKDFPNEDRESSPELAAAARPDRRQLGPLRADADPARRPRRHGRIPLPQRRAGRVHRPRDQGREAAGRREGVPQVESPAISTGRRSTSATSATGWCRRTRSSTSAGRWPSGRCRSSRARTISTSASPSTTPLATARRLSGDGQDGGRQHQLHRRLGRRHGDRQETARRQDLLLRGRRRHRQADREGERRVLRLAAALPRQAAAARSRHQAVRRVHRRRRPGDSRSAAAAARTTSGSSPPGPTKGRFAYLGFTNVWYRQLVRRRVQRHEGLHDHRPARLPARAEGEVQVLGPPRQVRHGGRLGVRQPAISRSKFTIPRARRSSRRRRQTDAYGGIEGEYAFRPTPRWASTD